MEQKINYIVVIMLIVTTTSLGIPLKGESKLDARFARYQAIDLLQFASKTLGEFQMKNFKNGDYEYIPLKGVEPVVNYDNISKEEFLRRNIIVMSNFHRMLRKMIQRERARHNQGGFRAKFVQMDREVKDLYSILRQLERINHLPTTMVSTTQYPSTTKARQESQHLSDSYCVMVMMDLLRTLKYLQRGLAEKFVFNN